MSIEDVHPPRPTLFSFPGTHHYLSPNRIPSERDLVALSPLGIATRWAAVLGAIGIMLTAIYLIVDGILSMGTGTVSRLFDLAVNPLIGLLVGILATAAIQSSSTVTALTVAAVGTGAVPVSVAIPVILGANIGTTITASIVSFGFLGHRGEFQRAFTAAALHRWFNVLFVAVIFPLEILFQPLQRLSDLLADTLVGDGPEPITTGSWVFSLFTPLIDLVGVRGLLGWLFAPQVAAIASAVLGTVLVLVAVRLMNSQLRTIMAASTRTLLKRSSGNSDVLGIAVGTVVTMTVQASAATISSLLPFAAAKTLKQRETLFLILGANIGTTFLALFTALAVPGSMGSFALQAALVHMLFNIIGTLLVMLIPPLRDLLLRLARISGRAAARGYGIAALVIALGYLAGPAVLLLGYLIIF